ncbi:MAG: hypothetical protein KDA84_16900, partial [Planctomycetaceae bacterium]|nr:hypothetical protein [Planctomycetaceae bacterium]
LRYGDWKLIVRGEGKDKTMELFNIADDPQELKNQAEFEPKTTTEMLNRFHQATQRDRDSVAKQQ